MDLIMNHFLGTILDDQTKLEIEFFKGVKVGINKITGTGHLTTTEVNQRILGVLEQAIQEDGIIDIFKAAEKSNPEISILSEEYLESIKKSKNKNIAAALLKRLIDGNIKVFKRTNLVKSELFSQKMAEIMNKWRNMQITNAEVIEELLKLAEDLKNDANKARELNLSVEEMAFYDALSKPIARKDFYTNQELIAMTRALTESLRKNRTIDWNKKDSARAKMRMAVKRLLKDYKYPPEGYDDALDLVLKQCELWSENQIEEVCNG